MALSSGRVRGAAVGEIGCIGCRRVGQVGFELVAEVELFQLLHALLDALFGLEKLAVVVLHLLFQLPPLRLHLHLALLELCGAVFHVLQLLADVLLDEGVWTRLLAAELPCIRAPCIRASRAPDVLPRTRRLGATADTFCRRGGAPCLVRRPQDARAHAGRVVLEKVVTPVAILILERLPRASGALGVRTELGARREDSSWGAWRGAAQGCVGHGRVGNV